MDIVNNQKPCVTLHTTRGKIVCAFAGDAITLDIQAKGEYDSNVLDSLCDVLAEIQPVVSLDIGANIGNHALVIADFSKRVIAFEPIDFVFCVLEKNIAQNSASHVQPVNVGLSNQNRTAEIFIPDNANVGSSSLDITSGSGRRLQVNTVVGDHYLQQCNIAAVDFIKMDVEGHEVPALQGLRKTIVECQPLLLLEYNNTKTLEDFSRQQVWSDIFAGYEVFSIAMTSSKKIHGKGWASFFKRIYYKCFSSHWVLSSFDPAQRYCNIYLVPQRFSAVFKTFPFMSKSV